MQLLICDNMALCNDAEVKRLLPLVSEQRRTAALRYKHIFGQWATLQSWLMLSQLGLPDTPWSFNEHGKPFIPDGLFFSISHCKTGIAVAVNDKPIGIDIESFRNVSPQLIDYTMNEEEQALINASDNPLIAFTEIWTRKEAFAKFLGTGIPANPKHLLTNTPEVKLTTTTSKDYAYTVCTQS